MRRATEYFSNLVYKGFGEQIGSNTYAFRYTLAEAETFNLVLGDWFITTQNKNLTWVGFTHNGCPMPENVAKEAKSVSAENEDGYEARIALGTEYKSDKQGDTKCMK